MRKIMRCCRLAGLLIVLLLAQSIVRVEAAGSAAAETRKPAPILARWRGLIGEYASEFDKLYVLESDGKLTALIGGIEYDSLQEVSNEVFKFPRNGAYADEQAKFVRGSDGEASEIRIGDVTFKRQSPGPIEGGVFHVTPPKPVEALRQEALAPEPPHEPGEFLKADLVDLSTLDPSIRFDIRYASSHNFLSTPVYSQPKAFLQRQAAEALVRANRRLHSLGYGLLIHDAYRPWYVTKIFWDATPPDKKVFVADPSEGSRHNRGCAVDLTLYELATGKPVEMTGVYDEMSSRSYAYYPGGTSLERWQRNLLREAMESEGFQVFEFEWWHFDYKDWRRYPILNLTFDQLRQAGPGRPAVPQAQ